MGSDTLMATNNFKPFAQAASANVMSQSDYEALSALLTGFQSGKASSAQINKALRQSSVMAYVLAQFISDSANVDVLDNGTPASILANMKVGMKKFTPGRLLNVLTFLTSGNYTPTSGTRLVRVKAVAGGGASGSEPASSSGNGAMSQSGYYGQYIDVIIPVSAFTVPVTIIIGAGGNPAAAGQNTGGTGGDTSFGNIFSLPGGPGGVSMPISSGPAVAGSSLASRNITTTIPQINSSSGVTKSSTVIQVTPGICLGQMPLPSPIEGGYYGSGGIGVPATTSAVQGNPGISGLMIIEEYA